MALEQNVTDAYEYLNITEGQHSSGSSVHTSNLSAASSYSSEERQSRPEKRINHDADVHEARSRRKRLRTSYSDRYRTLYNEAVTDIHQRDVLHRPTSWEPSKIGITKWSAEEKEGFFTALERLGRHNHPAIAKAIGTKTEIEVYVFIRLLNDASINQHLRGGKRTLLDAVTIPAAYELSEECDSALGEAADALALLQRKREQKREKELHGNYRLLTPKIAKEIDFLLKNGPDGGAKVAEAVPSAVLLNLRAFLDLSSYVFMNSTVKEYNWHSYAGRKERPSIYFTAFSDLMQLVTSITERLVQTAIFLAESRIRAVEVSGYSVSRHVRTQDMKSALDILGMKPDARDYWVGLPRRCKLKIIDRRGRVRKRGLHGERLEYCDVEKALAGGVHETDHTAESSSATRSRATSASPNPYLTNSSLPSSTDEASDIGSTTDDEAPSSPALSDSKLTSASPQDIRRQNQFDYRQHIYASALDHRNSLAEEQRLWALLGKEPRTNIYPAVSDIPKNPGPNRRERDELVEWQEETEYSAEWQSIENGVPAEHFARNRTTFRRRRRPVSQWEVLEEVERNDDDVSTDIDEASQSSDQDGDQQSISSEGEFLDEDELSDQTRTSVNSEMESDIGSVIETSDLDVGREIDRAAQMHNHWAKY